VSLVKKVSAAPSERRAREWGRKKIVAREERAGDVYRKVLGPELKSGESRSLEQDGKAQRVKYYLEEVWQGGPSEAFDDACRKWTSGSEVRAQPYWLLSMHEGGRSGSAPRGGHRNQPHLDIKR